MTEADTRSKLLAILADEFDIHFAPRGLNLDVVESHGWTWGNCADPVVMRLPEQGVDQFARTNGLELLALLISEEMDVDSATQLVSLSVIPNRFGGASLDQERR